MPPSDADLPRPLPIHSDTSLPPPEDFFGLCRSVGIELEQQEIGLLSRFAGLMMEANTRMNLTGVREGAELWTRHIFDALTLLALLSELDGPLEVLDIGSGGGLPAIPLAIVCPEHRFTLLEATGKKCDFLCGVIAALGLANAQVLSGRAEKFGHDRGEAVDRGGERVREGGYRERFDVVTSRAVGRVALAAELCVPFARVGGLVVLVKGAKAREELDEAKEALYLLHTCESGIVPTPTGQLVVLEKQRSTPKVYPRPDGEPKRSPLGVRGNRSKGERA